MRAPTVDAAMLDDVAQRVAGQSESNPFVLPNSLGGSDVKVVIPGDNVYMDSKYTFVPTFTEKTTLTHGPAGGWITRNWDSSGTSGQPADTKYFSIKAAGYESVKGEWVKYSNVGMVDGKLVDLKITINDWKEFYTGADSSGRNISFRKDEIAISTKGYEWVDLTWQFLDHDTQKPIKVSGYFTFGDIDMGQSIEFSKNATNAIDAIIVEPSILSKGSNLNMVNSNGQIEIHDTVTASEKASAFDEDSVDNSRDVRQRFSMMYSDQSELRFRWGVNTSGVANQYNHSKERYNGQTTNYAGGEYMFYEVDKPVPTLPGKAEKKGSVDLANGIGNYTITHAVPEESDKFHYKAYSLIDEVQPGLKNPKVVKITDQFGRDVSSWFTIVNRSKDAISTAKAAALNSPSFYGNTYTMHVTSEIDYDYVNSQNNGDFSFDNHAIVQTNNRVLETDPTYPVVQKQTVNIKHVNQDNGEVLHEESSKMLEGSSYSEDAIFNGSGYGTEGTLELDHVVVGGSNKGKQTTVTGRVPNKPLEITFYYRSPFKVTITHVDDDTGETIHVDQNIDQKFKGENWKYDAGLPSGKDTFTQDGVEYPYYPLDSSKSGKMDFQNGNKDYRYNIEFRYTKPDVDVALQSVKIKTDDNDKGLPIEIAFDMKSIDESHWGGEDRWASTLMNVQIIDRSNNDKVIYDQNHRTKDLRDETLKWTIPKDGLKVNEVRDYDIVLSAPDKETLFVRPGHGTIATKGYTASEETVKISSSNMPWNRSASEEWVAMTEKHVGDSDIKEHMEGIGLSVNETLDMPTGYGHGDVMPIQTWTSLSASEIPAVEGQVIADTELSEGDYETNSQGKHVIEVEEKESQNTTDKTAETDFVFPQTYVTEGGDGSVVVSDEQPEGAVDGGKRMYIPVWLDELGSYNYTFESTEPIGRNHVNVEIEQVVDVESYMFAHSDSATLDKDALLIQPTANGWFADFTQRDPFEVRGEHMWQAEDFTYDGNAVTGFSEEGLAYYNQIPDGTARLEIPTKNPSTGETITEIKGTTPDEKGSFYNYTFVGDFIAPSVTKIGDYAFYNSHFSGQFDTPELVEVGHHAFNKSQFIGTLNAPKLNTVGNYAFYHSEFEGEINVDDIGIEAFYHSRSSDAE